MAVNELVADSCCYDVWYCCRIEQCPSATDPVVDEEGMRLSQWLGSVLCIFDTVGWVTRRTSSPLKTCATYAKRFSSVSREGRKQRVEFDDPGLAGKQPLKLEMHQYHNHFTALFPEPPG